MGVTIHYEGRLRRPEDIEVALSLVERFAAARSWPSERFANEQTVLKRVNNETEEDWVYEGPTSGIVVRPPRCEPFTIEFDRDHFFQDFTKTQFADPEVHMDLVALLEELVPYVQDYDVYDEGEYFESRDEAKLLDAREAVFRYIDDQLANNPKVKGPVLAPSGRIYDLVEVGEAPS